MREPLQNLYEVELEFQGPPLKDLLIELLSDTLCTLDSSEPAE